MTTPVQLAAKFLDARDALKRVLSPLAYHLTVTPSVIALKRFGQNYLNAAIEVMGDLQKDGSPPEQILIVMAAVADISDESKSGNKAEVVTP